MKNGIVLNFDGRPSKQFGFIEVTGECPWDKERVFFHLNNGPGRVDDEVRVPKRGDEVECETRKTKRGLAATTWRFKPEVIPVWNGIAPDGEDTLNIQRSLSVFGLDDLVVTGKIEVRNEHTYEHSTVELGPMLLSQMCGHAVSKTITPLGRYHRLGFDIQVFRDGVEIGHIDSDRRFSYTTAPELRTCVGWRVATDWGRGNSLCYDLDGEVERLNAVIRQAPDDSNTEAVREFFDKRFRPQVEQALRYQYGSAFAGGYFGGLFLFWAVGTKMMFGRRLSAGNMLYMH